MNTWLLKKYHKPGTHTHTRHPIHCVLFFSTNRWVSVSSQKHCIANIHLQILLFKYFSLVFGNLRYHYKARSSTPITEKWKTTKSEKLKVSGRQPSFVYMHLISTCVSMLDMYTSSWYPSPFWEASKKLTTR